MKPHVLIVDDSFVIRRALQSGLLKSGEIGEVSLAASGRAALMHLADGLPDVVILDVVMPGMDGLEVLRQIRARYATLPVIMFSSLTRHAAKETIAALSLGASDYVRKPSGDEGVDTKTMLLDLIPRILALAQRGTAAGTRPPAPAPLPAPLPAPVPVAQAQPVLRGRLPIDVVAIGVSTGGPAALEQVIGNLPQTLPVPVLIVQHMPPTFTGYLAQRLDALSPLRVREAAEGDLLEPGGVWLAPGGLHMGLSGKRWQATVRLLDTAPEGSCKPAVDVMLRAVVEVFGGRALAVILTGMGQDGLRGCQDLRAAGGLVLAQDEASSVVWGMPRSVIEAGCADSVLPLEDIAGAIHHTVLTHRSRERHAS